MPRLCVERLADRVVPCGLVPAPDQAAVVGAVVPLPLAVLGTVCEVPATGPTAAPAGSFPARP